jgi:hypothetical protein
MEKEANSSQITPSKPKITFGLRFTLIWTSVFAVIGIVIQSINSATLALGSFFTASYMHWFINFTKFSEITLYPTTMDFLFALLDQWYYFFFTGGLISLVIAILSWLIHLIMGKKPQLEMMPIKPLVQSSIRYEPQTQVAKDVTAEAIEKPEQIRRIESVTQTKIEEWLEMGLLMLSEGNIEGAELIYEQISRAYDIDKDVSHETYKRILDFYYEIREKKK